MREKKYTAGPWKACSHSHADKEQWLSVLDGAFDLTHNGASTPAVIACGKYSAMSEEENKANAHLIFAAPELAEEVEWLRRVVAHIHHKLMEGQLDHAISSCEKTRLTNSTALAKAYGETE